MTEETRILVHALTRIANMELTDHGTLGQEAGAELLGPRWTLASLLFRARLGTIFRFYRRGKKEVHDRAHKIAWEALVATGMERNVCKWTGREIKEDAG